MAQSLLLAVRYRHTVVAHHNISALAIYTDVRDVSIILQVVLDYQFAGMLVVGAWYLEEFCLRVVVIYRLQVGLGGPEGLHLVLRIGGNLDEQRLGIALVLGIGIVPHPRCVECLRVAVWQRFGDLKSVVLVPIVVRQIVELDVPIDAE